MCLILGLDFAWSANGYVYHTRFDTIDQIPLGTLQRTGDNILALARGMAQGHQLANIESHRAGNLVFFDFLGAFVVRWPMPVADVVNLFAVILSFYSIFINMNKAYASDGKLFVINSRFVFILARFSYFQREICTKVGSMYRNHLVFANSCSLGIDFHRTSFEWIGKNDELVCTSFVGVFLVYCSDNAYVDGRNIISLQI